nr:MAG TPA: hypothetical protein [Caudoviricetes sp.]
MAKNRDSCAAGAKGWTCGIPTKGPIVGRYDIM